MTPLRPSAVASLLRRQPDQEPTGRWLTGRPDMGWPDAMISDRTVRWLPRYLLAATVAVCAGTAPALTGWPGFAILASLALAAGLWFEWWTRWDLSPLPRRILAFTVQWALMAGMVWINPLAAFYAFVGYLFAGTLFTGWMVLLGTLLTAVVTAGSQTGGHAQIAGDIGLFVVLIVINFAIAFGFVTLSNRREDAIRKRDQATRELVAAQQANLQLQRQLVDQARSAGVHDERARLARDLHDTVAQGLVAVITQLESIDDSDVDADVRRRLGNAKTLARQSLIEARRAVYALSAADLDDHPLPDALRTVVSGWAEQNRVPVRLSSSGRPTASRCDNDLIRVCQEALSNVARHARARSVAVTLTYLDDQVLMDIRDDGRGFDPTTLVAPGPDGGHGLAGMRHRLHAAGGELLVESEPGGGCVVSATMPIDDGCPIGGTTADGKPGQLEAGRPGDPAAALRGGT